MLANVGMKTMPVSETSTSVNGGSNHEDSCSDGYH